MTTPLEDLVGDTLAEHATQAPGGAALLGAAHAIATASAISARPVDSPALPVDRGTGTQMISFRGSRLGCPSHGS